MSSKEKKIIAILVIIIIILSCVLALIIKSKLQDNNTNNNTENNTNNSVSISPTNYYKYDIDYEKNKDLIDNGDGIIKSYQEYTEFTNKYNINKNIVASNFNKYNYVYSILTYDCGIQIYDIKEIKTNNNNINITYRGTDSCKCCNDPLLYMIAVDKNTLVNKIDISYEFGK